METFRIEHLTFAYPGQAEASLKDLSFSVGKGEFITVCGKSGCGKTTLLRQLKSVLMPHGEKSGQVFLEGTLLDEIPQREQAGKIGFVLQSPDNQLVTDKVWHELAFGLESLGYDTPAIRLRVAEMASFFGIETWFYKNVSELSGGQKQILNLASIMAMQPSVLLLDEPTSQLDPIAASDFLATLGKINRELGTTVLLSEHRLEDAFPLSDRVIVLDEGRILAEGAPRDVGQTLKEKGHGMFLSMPTPMRVYAGVESALTCPVTVREGRDFLDRFVSEKTLAPLPEAPVFPEDGETAVELRSVWFRYEKKEPDVLKGLSLKVPAGSFYAIVGGNGAGKTTALSLIAGTQAANRGEVLLFGKPVSEYSSKEKFHGMLGVLPQNPQALFVKQTVEKDLYEMLTERALSKEEKQTKIEEVVALCQLEQVLLRHPYDLSGGEQQRAALAKVLLLQPSVLLLDEPTKGLDGQFKETLAHILKNLQAGGATIILVSHDVEFCARFADRCALFFDGAAVTENVPRAFFSGNSFYTTAANRMARHLLPEAVTAEDVIAACGGTVEKPEAAPLPKYSKGEAAPQKKEPQKLPLWKKLLGGAFLAAALFLVFYLISGDPLPSLAFLPGEQNALPGSWGYALYALAASLFALFGAVLLSKKEDERVRPPAEKRTLSKRTVAAIALILLFIPLTLFAGSLYFGDRKYYFISILVVLEAMIPFLLVFEGRKPQARELSIIATLCAIAVAGRAAFFFLPQFKPVAAIVIIAAVAFGGETGFLVGAMSMLVSNVFFGQGPYTPFQMFAMGAIGFLAGILFQKGVLRRSRTALCVYGGLSVFFLYGFIMNTYTVFQTQQGITWGMILTACLSGVPMDLIHAVSTVFFLWAAGPAMLEKLDRIKEKYGLIS